VARIAGSLIELVRQIFQWDMDFLARVRQPVALTPFCNIRAQNAEALESNIP
jgi:hypothetical protein